ncbi:hypothetical protein HYT56_02870 [Candidatus Woesearchaeota archaeon]|nr:hypothetical protein [Candidatus Woesearchaeota archaeon]
MYKKIDKKWFYVVAIALLIIFTIKFFTFLEILDYFPINSANDLALKLSEVYFLSNYGFHGVAPNWFDGYKLFELHAPGWYYFALLFYNLTDNLQLAAFISLIGMLFLGLIASCLIFSHKFHEKILFFALFFMNPIMIDYIFFIGRFPELFAWIVYLLIFYLTLKYKDKKIDLIGYLLFIILTSIIILSHQYVAIFSLLFLFIMFIIKPRREKIGLFLSIVAILLITSFFWTGFLRAWIENLYAVPPTLYQKDNLLQLGSIISFNTFILLGWFVVFYFFQKDFIKKKKDKLFFYPILGLSILIITRIIAFIPVLEEVPPNSWNLFFLSLTLYMIFKTKFPKKINRIIISALLLIPILTAFLVFEIRTDTGFKYTPLQEEALILFQNLEGRYIIIKDNRVDYLNKLIPLMTVKYDLETPGGGNEIKLRRYLQSIFQSTDNAIERNDCKRIEGNLRDLKVKNIIAYKDSCEILTRCGFDLKFESEYLCLYILDNTKN